MDLEIIMGFPCDSAGKESACNVGDLCLIPRLGKSPGEGNGNPPQYSCLENSMDRGAGQATVYGTAKSDMTVRLTFISLSEIIILTEVSKTEQD